MIFRCLTKAISGLTAEVRELRLEIQRLAQATDGGNDTALISMKNDLDAAGNALKEAVANDSTNQT